MAGVHLDQDVLVGFRDDGAGDGNGRACGRPVVLAHDRKDHHVLGVAVLVGSDHLGVGEVVGERHRHEGVDMAKRARRKGHVDHPLWCKKVVQEHLDVREPVVRLVQPRRRVAVVQERHVVDVTTSVLDLLAKEGGGHVAHDLVVALGKGQLVRLDGVVARKGGDVGAGHVAAQGLGRLHGCVGGRVVYDKRALDVVVLGQSPDGLVDQRLEARGGVGLGQEHLSGIGLGFLGRKRVGLGGAHRPCRHLGWFGCAGLALGLLGRKRVGLGGAHRPCRHLGWFGCAGIALGLLGRKRVGLGGVHGTCLLPGWFGLAFGSTVR